MDSETVAVPSLHFEIQHSVNFRNLDIVGKDPGASLNLEDCWRDLTWMCTIKWYNPIDDDCLISLTY